MSDHSGSVAHSGDASRVNVTERPAATASGLLAVVVLAVALAAAILGTAIQMPAIIVVAVIVFAIVISSLTILGPGQTRVVQFFGRYIGTVRATGMTWVVPFTTRRAVSVRVRNFETSRLKVNDANGSPVEIAAIVVWQVADTAKAVFAVDNYDDFVAMQAESALRHIATTHPYEGDEGSTSLRGSVDEVADELAREVTERVALAGVDIVEVRISHLAYAPEIAQTMLRRQQADAVVAARERVVEGAVGMVELALTRLSERHVVELDDERRAAMVSNLMVVLCGDQPTSPIVNTGTLYSS